MSTANEHSAYDLVQGSDSAGVEIPLTIPVPSVGVADRRDHNQPTPVTMVEAESEIRNLLKDKQGSSLRKYMWLTTGKKSIWALAKYELLTCLLGPIPGAVGLFLRQIFYPSLFRRCGRGVVFGRNITIRHPHRIELGNNVVLDDNTVLDAKGDAETAIRIANDSILGRNSAIVCKGGSIDLAAEVNISVNCTLISESSLFIGEKTLIGGHTYIIAGGNHGTDCRGVPFVDQPRLMKGGVRILANCWLGANVTLLDGVTIGPNTIVGAAALVHRTMPGECVVGGVPAKVISQGRSIERLPS